jgi:hypothetical protein
VLEHPGEVHRARFADHAEVDGRVGVRIHLRRGQSGKCGQLDRMAVLIVIADHFDLHPAVFALTEMPGAMRRGGARGEGCEKKEQSKS